MSSYRSSILSAQIECIKLLEIFEASAASIFPELAFTSLSSCTVMGPIQNFITIDHW